MTWAKGDAAQSKATKEVMREAMEVVEWSVTAFEGKPPHVTALAISILLGGWLARYTALKDRHEVVARIGHGALFHAEQIERDD